MTPADLVVTGNLARFAGRKLPVSVGRGGITQNKREGDGATPIGAWTLLHGYWRADRTARPATCIPLEPIGPHLLWSDAPDDPAYNQPVRAPYAASHEKMRRTDPLYDIVIASDWNYPEAEAGKGSAIFVHCWRGPRIPTAGCVALKPDDLRWVLRRWTPASRVIVRG